MLLAKKVAVITGCNRGIGKSILQEFSKNGANLFACVRNIDEEFKLLVNKTEKEYKNKIIPIEIDLSNEKSVKDAGNNILSHKLDIDILVNNAGSIFTSLFQMTSINKYKELFDINFFSQILFTQLILKSMIKKKRGKIVFISSNSGIDGNEGRGAYASTKAAIIGQAKVLSRELGRFNIEVNTVAPGLTNTDMMRDNTKNDVIEEVIKQTSLKRVGNPDEIANVTLFLSSYLSDYITGQVIRVDGGM